MMKAKTVILLLTYGVSWINFYRFDQIEDLSSCRLIAIVGDKNEKFFPENKKGIFDKIYTVTLELNDEILESLSLDACLKIVSDESKFFSEKNTYVISVDEQNIELSGKIRDQLHLPGNSFSLLEPFRDKISMKKILKSKGIRVPNFLAFDQDFFQSDPINYYNYLVTELNSPFILKPKNSAGSAGVKKIDSFEEFNLFIGKEFIPSQYEAEEYIEGKLYHVDSASKDGRIIFSEVSFCSYPVLEITNGKTIILMPLLKSNPAYDSLRNFSNNALKVLGIPDGISHMEIFITKNNELVFLEVGARIPGAFIVRNYENLFNVNLSNLDFSIQAQLPFHINYRHNKFSFSALLPTTPGIVKKLFKPKLQNPYEIYWNVKKGDRVEQAKSLLDCSALLFVESENYESLLADMEILQNFMPIETSDNPKSK